MKGNGKIGVFALAKPRFYGILSLLSGCVKS
jgi:hypothetical protein